MGGRVGNSVFDVYFVKRVSKHWCTIFVVGGCGTGPFSCSPPVLFHKRVPNENTLWIILKVGLLWKGLFRS